MSESSHPSSRTWRVDFHVHTHLSGTVSTSPAEAVRQARRHQLDRIAITDHGTLEGAWEARKLDAKRIIVGEEITTRRGTQLIGLFLSRPIPQNLSLAQTVERIRQQEGLIYAPHPLGYIDKPDWHARQAFQVADLVEGWSGRIFFGGLDWIVRKQAHRRGLPLLAGSDAHQGQDIGRVYAELPSFEGPEELLKASRRARGRVHGRAGWGETFQALKPRLKDFLFGGGQKG